MEHEGSLQFSQQLVPQTNAVHIVTRISLRSTLILPRHLFFLMHVLNQLLLLPWRYSPRWAKASFFLGFHPEGFPSR
jgi:hypothetical protein